MQIPFELAPLGVLGGHQALPRGSQLLDQPNVRQDQAGLRRDVGDQAFAGGRKRLVRRHPDREGAEQLALVHDRRHGLSRRGDRKLISDHREDRRLGEPVR